MLARSLISARQCRTPKLREISLGKPWGQISDFDNWLGPLSENHLAVWGSAGYGNTIGSWNDEGGLWNISGYLIEFEAASTIPESGSTAGLMLASGFLGLRGLRRRFVRSR